MSSVDSCVSGRSGTGTADCDSKSQAASAAWSAPAACEALVVFVRRSVCEW